MKRGAIDPIDQPHEWRLVMHTSDGPKIEDHVFSLRTGIRTLFAWAASSAVPKASTLWRRVGDGWECWSYR